MAEEVEGSRLLDNGAAYRAAQIGKNGARHTPGNEYLPASPDTLSDGDNKGRDPEGDGGTIGTAIDIQSREAALTKNSNLYTKNKQYGHGGTA